MSSVVTVGELKNMLRGVDGRTKIKLIVLDDECKAIKMQGEMDFVAKPKSKGGEIVFYAGGQAGLG